MSEFGNETATATMKVMEKSMDALMSLLKFLLERNQKNIQNKLKSEELKMLQKDNQVKQIRDYLNKTNGYVRANKLYKSGENLIPIQVPLSQQELKKFDTYAKMSNLTYSSISDKRNTERIKEVKNELNKLSLTATETGLTKDELKRQNQLKSQLEELEKQRQNRIVIVRERDLEIVKEITDRMTMEIKLENIESEITELKAKHNLTEQEQQHLLNLEQEKAKILDSNFDSFNDKSNDGIISSALGKEKSQSVSFDRAISKVTDAKYLTEPCYVCERTKPNNYMEISSEQSVNDKGLPFTITEYKVFNDGLQQQCSEFSHGKFTHYSDRKGNNTTSQGDKHWTNMKNEMKTKGNFTNDLVMFKNKEDYLEYVTQYKAKENELNKIKEKTFEVEGRTYKDCMSIIKEKKEQLNQYGLTINENFELVNTKNNKPIDLEKNAGNLNVAKCSIIAQEIQNYTKINSLQYDLEVHKEDQDKTIYNKLNESLEECNQVENDLSNKSVQMESVLIVEDIDNDTENVNNDIQYEESKDLEHWNEQVDKEYDELHKNEPNASVNNKEQQVERETVR